MAKLINLSVKQFTFTIGGFECSKYIQDWNISIPISQYNTPCIWRGSFTIRFIPDKAIADGYLESDFSEVANPNRWRDGKATLTITIEGYTLPQLVIRDYNYNEVSKTGEGQLTQLIDLLDFERVGNEIPDTEFGKETDLSTVIKNLIVNAGTIDGVQIINPVNVVIPGVGEKLPIKIVSKTSVSDSQTFAGSVGRFIYQDTSGVIRTVFKPDVDAVPILFRSKTEVIPESGNKPINFAAEKIQVIGSRQIAKLPDSSEDTQESDEIDEKGRPKYIRTLTKKQLGELFPDELPGDTREVVVGIKEIFYRYEDDKNIPQFVPSNYVNLTPIVQAAITQFPFVTSGLKRDKLVQTITIEQGVIAEVFASDLPDALEIPGLPLQPKRFETDFSIPSFTGQPLAYFGFLIKSVLVETEIFRWNFQPKGIKFPDFPFDFFYQKLPLVLDQKEDLRTTLPGKTVLYGRKDPRTGKAKQLEKEPEREDRQQKPDFEFDVETINGFYDLTPNGWSTFASKTYQETFEYLPSVDWANILARKIGIREYGRRDGKVYSMPIPLEWLALGCPLFAAVDIGSARYIVENPQIIYQDGKAVFRFFGEKIGDITAIAESNPYPVFVPTGTLMIVPTPGIIGRVGSAINALQMFAVSGVPPYTFSAGFNPFKGLSIASNGIITGTPTLTHSGIWQITVTDSLLNSVTYDLSLVIQAIPSPIPIFNPVLKDTGKLIDSGRSIDDLLLDYAAIVDSSSSLSYGAITPDLLRIVDSSYSTFSIDGGGS